MRPSISTGTRLVRMVCTKEIPRFLVINGVRCKTWYRGQPLRCDICRAEGHKSASCPDKGKCRLCKKTGHFARSCPKPWSSPAAAPASQEPPICDQDTVTIDPANMEEAEGVASAVVNEATPQGDSCVVESEAGFASSGVVDSGGLLVEKVTPAHSESAKPDLYEESSFSSDESSSTSSSDDIIGCSENLISLSNNSSGNLISQSNNVSENLISQSNNVSENLNNETNICSETNINKATVHSIVDETYPPDWAEASQYEECEMVEAPGPLKRSASDVSTEGLPGTARPSRSRSPLKKKKTPGQHSLPGNLSKAARTAVGPPKKS